MPPLSRWMLRLALLHLAVGSVLGGLLLIEKATGALPALWAWRTMHREAMLVGGMMQLALGVALWILPRLRTLPARKTLGPFAALLLNAGVVAAGLGSAFGLNAVVLAGRGAVAAAAAAFAIWLLPRIRAIQNGAK